VEIFSIEYALLAMQRALLGEIIPALKAVIIDLDKEQQIFYASFYYDGVVSEQTIDLWDCAITEASAALGPDYFVRSQIKRHDYPVIIPITGYCAYLRMETNTYNKQEYSFPNIKIMEWSIGYALLSIQRALLGMVTSALRAVIVDMNSDKKTLYVRFYYDGEVDEKTIDLWKCAIKESSVNFGQDCILNANIERLDYPQKIPCHGRYAYLRKE
jgi:hypothetical protein